MVYDVEALAALPLFAACRRHELRRIAALAEPTRARPGELLMLERYRGAQVHLVVEGTARVIRGGATVATAGPGAILGELGVLRGIDRTATVVAETPMRLMTFDADGFLALVRDHPSVARSVHEQAAAHTAAAAE